MRQRFAQELHDQVAQSLTTMVLEIEEYKVVQTGRHSVLEELATLQASTREVLQNIRELLYDLRDEPTVTLRFVDDIRSGRLSEFQARTGVKVRLVVSSNWPRALSREKASHLERIIQEALHNAWRHGRARNVRVALGVGGDGRARLTVKDDGLGFVSEGFEPGLGIRGMHERAAIVGAELSILSQPGIGTMLTATFAKDSL